MTYTFWHSGILIGESDLEEASGNPRQRGGIFRPTAYGLEVFPRLSGFLSAGHALKTHLEANGMDPENLEGGAIDDLLENTTAGQQILGIGCMLIDVEVRSPDGSPLELASIVFSDLLELHRLTLALECEGAADLQDLPADAPRYIVSATFRDDASRAKRDPRSGSSRRENWSRYN